MLIPTCLVVAGPAVWFAVERWDVVDRVATVLSTLSAVAAVGVAVWDALRPSNTGMSAQVSDTGTTAGRANGRAKTMDAVRSARKRLPCEWRGRGLLMLLTVEARTPVSCAIEAILQQLSRIALSMTG
jgi:hypothetical protein